MKRLVIGMTAHVDAGKTTLAEALLYRSGEIRKLGRVDKGSSYLDTHIIERNRGITVFSKQAVMHIGDDKYILLDTPGHIDFSAETERALQVLDYAVLVISGTDGVQSHTETLWELLKRYKIPVFIFVNKMDLSKFEIRIILNNLQKRLSTKIVDFSLGVPSDEFYESLALCSENLMNIFLENGSIPDAEISNEISERNIFPCCFGSALKLDGVDRLLEIIRTYTSFPNYDSEFGARVYKITTENGVRLTHMKITGGKLRVRDSVKCGKELCEEKVSRLRIYSGAVFKTCDEVLSGELCAAEGLSSTFAGEGIGAESDGALPILEPVLSYSVILPNEIDPHTALGQLKKLEEEEPQLHVLWNEQLRQINVQLMGEIQLEILKSLVSSRFGWEIGFDEGEIAYRETISEAVEGVGHYEPLRHYAEVHLLMEPAEAGSGLVFASNCSGDKLDRNWQRLIMTHLKEKTHIGVLTGSPITDIKITLIAGKSHIKHTEGGDFRQATYRAVRMGLKSTKSILLEPWYEFRLEIPQECVGRALSDLQRKEAEFTSPEINESTAIIIGSAPVSVMRGYHTETIGYTHGKGKLQCMLKGYYPCKNPEEVISRIGYDSESDMDNPADSVFCSHGVGTIVKWYDVRSRMHIDSGFRFKTTEQPDSADIAEKTENNHSRSIADDDELMAIFERTYGKIKRPPREAMHTIKADEKPGKSKPVRIYTGKEYLLVDGYNIIFSWDELRELAKDNLDLARSKLINAMCNYQGFKQCELILVFDAYKVAGNHRETERIAGITVIYTKEAETADMYIEKTSHKLAAENRVRVATSDGMEQLIILGNDAFRMSAEEFHNEVRNTEKAMREYFENN